MDPRATPPLESVLLPLAISSRRFRAPPGSPERHHPPLCGAEARGHRRPRPRHARTRDGRPAPRPPPRPRRPLPRRVRGWFRPPPPGTRVPRHRRPGCPRRALAFPRARRRRRRHLKRLPRRVRRRLGSRRCPSTRRAERPGIRPRARRRRPREARVGRTRGRHPRRRASRDGPSLARVREQPRREGSLPSIGGVARAVLPPRTRETRADDGHRGGEGGSEMSAKSHGAARVPRRDGRRQRHAIRQGIRARRHCAQRSIAGRPRRAIAVRGTRRGREIQGTPPRGTVRVGVHTNGPGERSARSRRARRRARRRERTQGTPHAPRLRPGSHHTRRDVVHLRWRVRRERERREPDASRVH